MDDERTERLKVIFRRIERNQQFLDGIEKRNGGKEGMGDICAQIGKFPKIFEAFLNFTEALGKAVSFETLSVEEGIDRICKVIEILKKEENIRRIQTLMDQVKDLPLAERERQYKALLQDLTGTDFHEATKFQMPVLKEDPPYLPPMSKMVH